MRRLLVMMPLLLGLASAASLDDPIHWLRQSGRVGSAHFELAHATYSVWRVRWQRPAADLRLVFASNAATPAEAGQLRELTVSSLRPESAPLSRADGLAVLRATRQLAAHCALKVPRVSQVPLRELTIQLAAGAHPACTTPAP